MDCHTCGVNINVFEFEKVVGGWTLVQSDIAAFTWGSWRSLGASDVDVRVVGRNLYGIFLSLGYTMGGSIQDAIAIWFKVGDEYRKIFHNRTAEGTKDLTTKNQQQLGPQTLRLSMELPGSLISCLLLTDMMATRAISPVGTDTSSMAGNTL